MTATRPAAADHPSTLYEPLGVLKPVGDGLWVVDGPQVKLPVVGAAVSFPTRMTVVQLSDGGLWCHSPIALDDAEAAACLERMLAWKPERVVLAHGRWYDHDGSAELRRAFRWLL